MADTVIETPAAPIESRYTVGPHPTVVMLVQFPFVCFALTLLTDIAYWQTGNLLWQHFSEWLLLAGLVFGGLSVIAGALDFLLRRDIRSSGPSWPYALVGGLLVLVIAFVNSLVHAGDGWTGVVPYGLVLSFLTVAVMAVTDWLGYPMFYGYTAGARRNG